MSEIHWHEGMRVSLQRIDQTENGLLEEPFYFQVPPLEELSRSAGFAHTDYDTISAGQFSRPGGRLLQTVELNTLAVDYNPPWATAHGGSSHTQGWGGPLVRTPLECRDELIEIAEAGTPFRLLARNPVLWGELENEIDMDVTLRNVTVTEKAGEVDARYFNLSFVEWRNAEVDRLGYGRRKHPLPARVVIGKAGPAVEVWAGGTRIADKKDRHRIGTADAPATLRKLAKHFYGNYNWRPIAKANGLDNVAGDRKLNELSKDTSHSRKWSMTVSLEGVKGGMHLVIPEPPRAAESKSKSKNKLGWEIKRGIKKKKG